MEAVARRSAAVVFSFGRRWQRGLGAENSAVVSLLLVLNRQCDRRNFLAMARPGGSVGAMRVRVLQSWAALVRSDAAAVAVVESDSGRVCTRGELAAESAALVKRLRPLADVRRRRVLLMERNGAAWLAGFLALLDLGAVPVLADAEGDGAVAEERLAAVRAAGVLHGGGVFTIGGGRAPLRRGTSEFLCKLTSGTTGAPRVLPFTEAQVVADGKQVVAGMGIGPSDRNLAVIPFGHSYGLGNLVLPLLLQGTGLVVAGVPLPSVLAEVCARWSPTVFPSVPAVLRGLVVAETAPEALASLRLVISAGAVLPAETARAFLARFGRRVHSFYGSSETGGITFDTTGTAAEEGRSVGTPLPGVRLRWTSARRFRVEGSAVCGFGSHRMADFARINALGEVVLEGRAGRFLKCGARRVSVAEIEAPLRALDGVREVWVGQHPGRADSVAAVLASTQSPASLRRALASRLAAWKIPDTLLVVDQLPLTPRGKVDAAATRALLR